MPPRSRLTGKRFGRLTVISFVGIIKGKSFWLAECDCGKRIKCCSGDLNNGHTKSCGSGGACNSRYVHGKSGSRIYLIWRAMMDRCYSSWCDQYKNYGARGIRVCRAWHKFEPFYRDMGEKPPGLSLGRINNSLGYSKKNCRWETQEQQTNNRRGNHLLMLHGKKMTAHQWARKLNMRPTTIFARIKLGWSDAEILTIPVQKQYRSGNVRNNK